MNEEMTILVIRKRAWSWRESAERIPAISAHRHDLIAERIIDDAFEKVINHNVDTIKRCQMQLNY